jgi:vanillate/3-O-methylgallate O-demethylase
MSGNLAYEVHGPMADFEEVYRTIWAAGQAYGARKLGMLAYSGPNHTEAGFPNILIHYPMPWFESDEAMTAYMTENLMMSFFNWNRRLHGSVGDDLDCRFVTPYDVGWGFLVNFNHEFTGKTALEAIAQHPPRTLVTLEWNGDDVGAVFASQFQGNGAEVCERIDLPVDMYYQDNITAPPGVGYIYRADKVLADGKWIGVSAGRAVSYYYNTMISLAFIDPAFAVEGQELTLIWGTPGTPQKEIRVKVARCPYIDLIRNEDRDVSTIPHYAG